MQFDSITEKNLLHHARRLGYEAFIDCRHYSENIFREADWQRRDAWDEGWALAEKDNPGRFNADAEIFC